MKINRLSLYFWSFPALNSNEFYWTGIWRSQSHNGSTFAVFDVHTRLLSTLWHTCIVCGSISNHNNCIYSCSRTFEWLSLFLASVRLFNFWEIDLHNFRLCFGDLFVQLNFLIHMQVTVCVRFPLIWFFISKCSAELVAKYALYKNRVLYKMST